MKELKEVVISVIPIAIGVFVALWAKDKLIKK